jgi:hypothetical protein
MRPNRHLGVIVWHYIRDGTVLMINLAARLGNRKRVSGFAKLPFRGSDVHVPVLLKLSGRCRHESSRISEPRTR